MSQVKLKAIKDKQTQTQILSSIADETELSKKEVQSVLESLGGLTHRHIMQKGSGEFKIPYMGIKVNQKDKPATKKRMGRNPATGEEMVIAAKPKCQAVKVMALKSIKDLLEKK